MIAALIAFPIVCLISPGFSQNHVFLIDHSGSMRPYYQESFGDFQNFIANLLTSAARSDEWVEIRLFSKKDPKKGIESPRIVASGKRSRSGINGKSFTDIAGGLWVSSGDTDLRTAISEAKGALSRRPDKIGVIWLMTDNVSDSQGLDPDKSAESEREALKEMDDFYENLKTDAQLQKIACFPVERKFGSAAHPIVLYAILYSDRELAAPKLAAFNFQKKELVELARTSPIICKPLAQGALNLEPKIIGGKGAKGLSFIKQNEIYGAGAKEGEAFKATLKGLQIVSSLTSHYVSRADLDAVLGLAGATDKSVKAKDITLKVNPKVLEKLGPGGRTTKEYEVDFNLPPFKPGFSWQSIFDSEFEVKGYLELRASRPELALNPAYASKLERFYGLRKLPEFFQPKIQVISSRRIPVTLVVSYAWWRLLLVLFLGLALLALIVSLIYFGLLRSRRYRLIVDGQANLLTLSPLRKTIVQAGAKMRQDVGEIQMGLSNLKFRTLGSARLVDSSSPALDLSPDGASFNVQYEYPAGKWNTATIKLESLSEEKKPVLSQPSSNRPRSAGLDAEAYR